MVEGSASTLINLPTSQVYEAVSDITRMGDWSPECVAGRWSAPAAGPAVGAEFEGDNIAKLGPVTLKKWTTTSKVSECVTDEVFEFVTEGYTTWRYELEDVDGATRLTESFEYAPYSGWQKFMYETLGRRSTGMVTGIEETLARVKAVLEG